MRYFLRSNTSIKLKWLANEAILRSLAIFKSTERKQKKYCASISKVINLLAAKQSQTNPQEEAFFKLTHTLRLTCPQIPTRGVDHAPPKHNSHQSHICRETLAI